MRGLPLRSAFTVATTASVIFLVASIGMWIRSCRTQDHFIRYYPGGSLFVESDGCSILIWHDPNPFKAKLLGYPGWTYERWSVRRSNELWGHFDVTVDRRGGISLRIPYWFICIVFCVVPTAVLLTFRARRRASRRQRGLCASCGYDLRASTERCPECGSKIATADGRGASMASTRHAGS